MYLHWWQHLLSIYCMWLSLGHAVEYELRVDLLSPCPENQNNSVRFGALNLQRLPQNRLRMNGTVIVDKLIEGPLMVCE